MLKKATIGLLSVLLLFGLLGPVSAQPNWLPEAGITPDSPFYFLDGWGEGISMTFTFSSEAKANKALRYSEERLAEMDKLSEKGKEKVLERTSKRYQHYLSLAQKNSEKVKENKRARVRAVVASSTSRHFGVLDEVASKVPEQAKQAINEAKERSKQGHMQSLNALAKTKPEQAAKIGVKAAQGRMMQIEQATGTERAFQAKMAARDFEDLSKNLQQMTEKTNRVRVQEMVASSTSKHLRVLERVREKAPEQAKSAIQKAMRVSTQGRERAMEALQKKADEGSSEASEALENIEGAGPMPVPPPGSGRPNGEEPESPETPSDQKPSQKQPGQSEEPGKGPGGNQPGNQP